MRIAAVSSVDMVVDPDQASAKFFMRTRRLQASVLIGATLIGIGGLLIPVALILLDAISGPQVFHTLAEHPGSTVLLAAGIAIGLALLTFPLRAGLARLGGASTVQMANGVVTVERPGLFTGERWSVPLNQFCGVTHHIRATLSGPRHEIILVHPEPNKDVLLHLANRHPQEGAEHYARLLGLSEMQPKVLYDRHRMRQPEARPAEYQAKAA